MTKPESPTARRRRIAAKIEGLEADARMFDRWATGYRAEAESLKRTLAELTPPPARKEQRRGLPY